MANISKVVYLGHEKCVINKYLPTDIDYLYFDKDNFDVEKIIQFKPDLIIEKEVNDGKSHYEAEYQYIRSKIKTKIAGWLIDTHIIAKKHLEYAKNFDILFLSISRYVDFFKKYLKIPVYHLPLCFPDNKLPPFIFEKKYQIAFFGQYGYWYPRRTHLLKSLDIYHETDYDNYLKKVGECLYGFNCSINNDLNFRVFEYLACGVTLITDEVEDIYKVEDLNKYLYIYKTDEEAKILVEKAKKGELKRFDPLILREFIRKNHLIYHRIEKIISLV